MTIQTLMIGTLEMGAVSILSSSISYAGVGTSTSTPAVTQTQLGGETYREAIFASSTTSSSYKTSLYLDVTENNGNVVAEIGTFTASSGAPMVSRNNTIVSTKTSSKEFYYDLQFNVTATNI